ncbi:unnamed protein product, partial [Ixodes pacificus]
KKKKKKTVGAVALSIVKRHAQCHSADIFLFFYTYYDYYYPRHSPSSLRILTAAMGSPNC